MIRWYIIYSWGVLHHSGDMWKALDNVAPRVAPGSCLFIAIYNDQGTASVRWRKVKRLYNQLPPPLRFLVLAPCFVALNWQGLVKDCLRLRPGGLGGHPFEVSTPRRIFEFYKTRGFSLHGWTPAWGEWGAISSCSGRQPAHAHIGEFEFELSRTATACNPTLMDQPSELVDFSRLPTHWA